MIQMKRVELIQFSKGKDAYGQKRKNGSESTEIEMYIVDYNKQINNLITHIDADYIGLTRDEVGDGNQIIDGDKTYEVLYVMPTHRYTQVFMKRVV